MRARSTARGVSGPALPVRLLTAGILQFAFLSCAQAQSLEPMRGKVVSFADRFALKVYPGNPYDRRQDVTVRVYDEAYRPIAATVTPARAATAAHGRRRVLVVVPFEDARSRVVRVCAEATPRIELQARLRTQVCGRFVAERRG